MISNLEKKMSFYDFKKSVFKIYHSTDKFSSQNHAVTPFGELGWNYSGLAGYWHHYRVNKAKMTTVLLEIEPSTKSNLQ